MTAYVKYSFEAWSTGASGYLLKPVTVENLREQLKNLRYPLLNMGGGRDTVVRYYLSYFILGAMFFIAIFGFFISEYTPGINKLNKKFFLLMF